MPSNSDYHPGFEVVVTNDWLDAVISNGSWDLTHGSGLDRWIDDLKGGLFSPRFDMPQHLLASDDIEIISDPEFRLTLAGWLKTRYDRVVSDLNSADLSRLGRRMSVDETWLPSLKEGIGSAGIYWGELPLDGGGFWYDESKPIDVYIEVHAAPNAIDWVATIRARLDYVLGDEEREVRLKPSAQVSVAMLDLDGTVHTGFEGLCISTGNPWPRPQSGNAFTP